MRIKSQQSDSDNQLRPVILLLVTAVILPTVCLLWFMTQAVKNESLAIRQEIVDVYKKEIEELSSRTNARWNDFVEHTHFIVQSAIERNQSHNCVLFKHFLDDTYLLKNTTHLPVKKYFAGMIVYGADGKIEYPPVSSEQKPEFALPGSFMQAWASEYEQKDFGRAIEFYNEIETNAENDFIRRSAIIGRVRCLRKQGKLYDAYATCFTVLRDVSSGSKGAELYDHVKCTQSASLPLIVQGRILRATIFKEMLDRQDPDIKSDMELYRYASSVTELYTKAYNDYSPVSRSMSAETRIHLLQKFLELAEDDTMLEQIKSDPDESHRKYTLEQLDKSISNARQRLAAEEVALSLAEKYPTFNSFGNWQEDDLRKLGSGHNLFALYHKFLDKFYVTLVRPETVQLDLNAFGEVFDESLFEYQILDSNYKHIAGIEHKAEDMVIETGFSEYFSDWKVRLYYKDNGVFEKAAGQAKMSYVWTAVLVIGVMLVVSALAGKALMRQARINRLKNDFVATVSHELKTPLASMRVLVDTVLEGNYKDETQVREYLELVAKENKRLTGLIDNFLTFSRMERNKQAFNIVPTSAKQIADDAADAVGTRFEQSGCKLNVTIDEQLPSIDADHDAMVTVLVNLLDNAWKYSSNDKKIEFSVYAKDSSVCFAVKDNGDGMTRRTARKIFDRFYQADSTLARKAEGCGLGLSIVKFIVNAHGGTIEVDSETGKGSLFRVKIPT